MTVSISIHSVDVEKAVKVGAVWFSRYVEKGYSGRVHFEDIGFTGWVKDVKSHLTVNNPRWEVHIRDVDSVSRAARAGKPHTDTASGAREKG